MRLVLSEFSRKFGPRINLLAAFVQLSTFLPVDFSQISIWNYSEFTENRRNIGRKEGKIQRFRRLVGCNSKRIGCAIKHVVPGSPEDTLQPTSTFICIHPLCSTQPLRS